MLWEFKVMNIDEKLKKLQEISDKLDDNSITFDESIKLFEEGSKIVKELYANLNEAKGKITVLKQDLDKYKEEGMNV